MPEWSLQPIDETVVAVHSPDAQFVVTGNRTKLKITVLNDEGVAEETYARVSNEHPHVTAYMADGDGRSLLLTVDTRGEMAITRCVMGDTEFTYEAPFAAGARPLARRLERLELPQTPRIESLISEVRKDTNLQRELRLSIASSTGETLAPNGAHRGCSFICTVCDATKAPIACAACLICYIAAPTNRDADLDNV